VTDATRGGGLWSASSYLWLLLIASVEDDYECDEERESRDELLHGSPLDLLSGARVQEHAAC
jgi:hypothetical protein